MKIAGVVYADGVGTHAPSLALIKLAGRGQRFGAMVGVTDGLPEGGSVEFIVSGDGRVLFDSEIVRGGQPAKPVDVSLAGVQMLTLQVTDAGDGMNSDHANWADAKIECSGAVPEIIDPGRTLCPGRCFYPPAEHFSRRPRRHLFSWTRPAAMTPTREPRNIKLGSRSPKSMP